MVDSDFSVIWSEEDQEHVGLCKRHPHLSHLDPDREKALQGIKELVEFGEQWLWENEEAVAMVRQGLAESASGMTAPLDMSLLADEDE